jgi:hypothetical protein
MTGTAMALTSWAVARFVHMERLESCRLFVMVKESAMTRQNSSIPPIE